MMDKSYNDKINDGCDSFKTKAFRFLLVIPPLFLITISMIKLYQNAKLLT